MKAIKDIRAAIRIKRNREVGVRGSKGHLAKAKPGKRALG